MAKVKWSMIDVKDNAVDLEEIRANIVDIAATQTSQGNRITALETAKIDASDHSNTETLPVDPTI